MRRLATVVSAGAALVLALSACAEPTAGFGGQPTPPPSSAQPTPEPGPEMDPPAGGKPLAKNKADLSALPADFPKRVWTEGDGTVVGTFGKEGGCSKVRADLTEQTDTGVKITLVETTPANSEACTMDLRFPPVTVKLAKPLGERTVAVTAKQETK
ncbi:MULTISPECIES: hypothetical protein [unclassified Crossiella]|uniref:hypothetical protein n=1 Tax=unclassified Crossiella TaxID=2620835 RepID=UPI001FFFAD7B|nr:MULTISPECIES: hypothetical protein [unclassified Crossiella]MCK2240383.1 hypothetical protein [Crossiella sp. S99.2]MCK2253165.1 hypothetical protein [Crossiella sp. S99.1]